MRESAAGTAFAGAIESDDPSGGIEHDDQGADGIENRCNHVAFFFQCFFGSLQVGDIEPDPVNEPRPAIVAPDHLGLTMEPDHATIARKHPVCRAQRFARQKQVGCFHAPAQFVVGMNLRIPAHRILKPLFLRETERCLYLRTNVGFADCLVEISHEHDGRNLFDQRAVFCLQAGQRRPTVCWPLGAIRADQAGIFEENFGEVLENGFGLVAGLAGLA